MRLTTEREFKSNPSKFLNGQVDTVVTRRGRPMAMVSPLPRLSVADGITQMGRALRGSSVTKRELLKLLKEARQEVYGRPRCP